MKGLIIEATFKLNYELLLGFSSCSFTRELRADRVCVWNTGSKKKMAQNEAEKRNRTLFT